MVYPGRGSGAFYPANVGPFTRTHILRKLCKMRSPITAIKEPVQQASLASAIAVGISMLALAVAVAAIVKSIRSPIVSTPVGE